MNNTTLWVWPFVQGLSEEDLWVYASSLGSDELDALSKIKNTRRRREYVCGHYLLRFALSHNSDVPLVEWPISHRDDLGPELGAFQGGSATFNLSHSNNTICCLVADKGAVGVDIEWIDVRRDVDKLAGSFFSAGEASVLKELPASQRHAYFYRLWTLKECTIKAKRQGISFDGLKGLCFADRNDNEGGRIDSSLYPLSHFAFRLGGFQISYCLRTEQDRQVDIRLYRPNVQQSMLIVPRVDAYVQLNSDRV